MGWELSIRRHALAVLASLSLLLRANDPAAAEKAEDIHWKSWDQCLDSVASVPAARYAFYAYRTLAVPHPEIYLRADRLFAETVEDLPGSRLAYRTRDLRDIETFLRLARRESKGGAFSWDMMTLVPDSIFDTDFESSMSNWLDRRAPSAAVLLKSVSPHLSTLESSILRYTQTRRVRRGAGPLFVVVDETGAGYLATDSALWLAGLQGRTVTKPNKINPVLVFNETSVYYPLFSRDDRNRDSALSSLVDRLGPAGSIPLRGDNLQRVQRLRENASLLNDQAEKLAVLVASGLVDLGQPRVLTAWADYVAPDSGSESCAIEQAEECFFWANHLSRHAAEYASLIRVDELEASLVKLQERHLERAGRRVNPFDSSDVGVESWGCLWSYDLMLTVFDDNIRTRAGSSLSQALAMSAVLDLAGIDQYRLSVQLGDKQIPDQEWLFTGDGRHQFNLGVWTTLPEVAPTGYRTPTLLISGFAIRGWPVRIRSGRLCSRLEASSVSEHLGRIGRKMQLASIMIIPPEGEVTSLQKFLAELTDGRFQPMVPHWPTASSGD